MSLLQTRITNETLISRNSPSLALISRVPILLTKIILNLQKLFDQYWYSHEEPTYQGSDLVEVVGAVPCVPGCASPISPIV